MKHKESIILWGMIVALMFGIFYFSSQPADKSNDTSHKLVGRIAYIIYPQYRNMTQVEKKVITLKYNHIIRKLAHATLYFFLAAFSIMALGVYNRFEKNSVGIALIICVVFAISDELHQGFVPGRSPQLADILIDFSGVALAILISKIIRITINVYPKKSN